MDEALKALVEQGRAILTEMRTKEEAKEAELERQKREKWVNAWYEFGHDLAEALPDGLLPYVTSEQPRETEERYRYPDRHGSERLLVSLPGFIPFVVRLVYDDSAKRFVLAAKAEPYLVPYPELEEDYDYYGGHRWRILQRSNPSYGAYETSDLALALAVAEERGTKLRELEAELATKQEKQNRQRQDEQAEANAKAELHQAEKQRLLSALDEDPVALSMLRVFVAIQKERDGWQEQIDSAGEHLHEMDARTSRRVQELQERVTEAERQANEASYRAREAEDKASAAVRKARRGW